MKENDHLDFNLQYLNDEILVTLLINRIPLYDQVICNNAALKFNNEDDKLNFINNSYSFNIYPIEYPSEETLFYHNFPQNLMPVDPKHTMVGLSLEQTYSLLASPFLIHNELGFTNEEIIEINNELDSLKFDSNYVCLCHTCGVINCSNIQLKIAYNPSTQIISFNHIKDSFGSDFHPDVQFNFNTSEYIETLKKLENLKTNMKTYQEYTDFVSNRFYNNL